MALYNESEFIKDTNSAVEFFQARTKQLRAGRVRADMFEEIPVMAYGMSNPLKNVANIDVKGPLEVTIQPWDPGIVNDVYKALQEANLGFNPGMDGNKVRINVPPLTEETRKATVKELGGMMEEAKVSIRQIRHKYNEIVDKQDGVSEDEQKRSKDAIQKLIDKTNERLEEISDAKEQELMSI